MHTCANVRPYDTSLNQIGESGCQLLQKPCHTCESVNSLLNLQSITTTELNTQFTTLNEYGADGACLCEFVRVRAGQFCGKRPFQNSNIQNDSHTSSDEDPEKKKTLKNEKYMGKIMSIRRRVH